MGFVFGGNQAHESIIDGAASNYPLEACPAGRGRSNYTVTKSPQVFVKQADVQISLVKD